jgi:8-oxo-dGTP diphosphatase
MRGDGDAWVHCAAGHRHWGRYGAAGLFLTDGHRVVLQHRAPWTHEGGTWGLPGGARDTGESPVRAALREAHEEAAVDGTLIDPIGMSVADHDGWSYTTVIARPLGQVAPLAANAESVEIRWWDLDEVEDLPLHPGLAASWPVLRQPVPRLVLVVPHDLLDVSSHLRESGVPASLLPEGLLLTPLSVLVPRVTTDRDRLAESEVLLRVGTDVPLEWLVDLIAH